MRNPYNLDMINLLAIVAEMKRERDRLDSAINALEGVRSVNRHRSPRKGKAKRRRGVRKMSAAARTRISKKMKARWAKAKKAGKNTL